MAIRERFYSLDVFRGATVALMILVNNPGTWSHIYDPLEHAAWHGCTPTDLVFPFFLFAVGNALAFVLPGLETQGDAAFWKKTLKRTLLIFAIGLFLNWFPFVKYDDSGSLVFKAWKGIRIFGVLQRISLAYFFASVIAYYLKPKGAFVAGCALLLIYWFACLAGNPSDPYSLNGWFGTSIDKAFIGESHMYHGEGVAFDPEGLVNTTAAITQVIFGYLVGTYIVQKGKTYEMVSGLFVAGMGMVFTGFVWDMFFPINKKIWTSSYTVYTTGLAMCVIALMIYLIELKGKRGWFTQFFNVFGKNPLFIFAMSALIPKSLNLIRIPVINAETGKQRFVGPLAWVYEKVISPVFSDPRNSSLLYALCFITMMWLLAYILDRRKIYIKV